MMKVLVAQSYLTISDPMDCSPPGSSVDGILQARILEWVAIPFSRGVFLDQGTEPKSPALQADSLPFKLLLLLLLSRFSRVWLCATPETEAHQAPPSLGFSRQEHWSGLPFPSPMHESESEVSQSCLTLSDPMNCSSPGSSIHGIFQARVLEWGVIAFSDLSY